MSMPATIGHADRETVIDLHAEYAAAVDGGEWTRWPAFFTERGVYRLQPRENFERGFPLATLAFDSRAMMQDRVYGITETLFHDPYYQRHVIGLPRMLGVDASPEGWRRLRCETNYAVFRTKLSDVSTVFNVGRYLDTIVVTPEGARYAERLVIYDSEMIPNSIIYPI